LQTICLVSSAYAGNAAVHPQIYLGISGYPGTYSDIPPVTSNLAIGVLRFSLVFAAACSCIDHRLLPCFSLLDCQVPVGFLAIFHPLDLGTGGCCITTEGIYCKWDWHSGPGAGAGGDCAMLDMDCPGLPTQQGCSSMWANRVEDTAYCELGRHGLSALSSSSLFKHVGEPQGAATPIEVTGQSGVRTIQVTHRQRTSSRRACDRRNGRLRRMSGMQLHCTTPGAGAAWLGTSGEAGPGRTSSPRAQSPHDSRSGLGGQKSTKRWTGTTCLAVSLTCVHEGP
jgi:hypothetical protein